MSTIVERFELMPRDGVDPAAGLRVREGTMADYDALAGLHYRGGRPATVVGVYVATYSHEHIGTLTHQVERPLRYSAGPDVVMWPCGKVPMSAAGCVVGVLVVSMPTLNGRWRELAWPRRFLTGDRRADARRLNREVRTISRVIVEPRWRGLGVATRLVREYLVRARTVRTEAVAAMGACCPFFERAGMRAWKLEPDRRGARLMRALREEGMEAWELCGRARVSAGLERELRVWANDSRATRRLVGASVGRLCRGAAGALSGGMAYTHERPTGAEPYSYDGMNITSRSLES